MSRFVRIFLGMFSAIPTNQHNKHSPKAIHQTRPFFLPQMSDNKHTQRDHPLRTALSVYIHFQKHPPIQGNPYDHPARHPHNLPQLQVDGSLHNASPIRRRVCTGLFASASREVVRGSKLQCCRLRALRTHTIFHTERTSRKVADKFKVAQALTRHKNNASIIWRRRAKLTHINRAEPRDRPLQSFFELNLWFPFENAARKRDIRATLRGIVLR